MPRTLAERVQDWQWWGEQGLHLCVVGAPPVAIAMGCVRVGFPGCEIVGGALAAAWVAGVREFEQRPVGDWGDLLVDVAITIAGGALTGLIFMVTRGHG